MNPARARAFVIELGAALHRAGAPAHRLENALTGVARRLGMEAQCFTTPTQLMVAFGAIPEQQVVMLRVEPGEIDLAKLAALDGLADAVVAGEVDVDEGLRHVQAIASAPKRYRGWAVVLAFGLTSAAVARFFDGGLYELATAGVIGLAIGVLSLVFTRSVAGTRVFELVAAFVAASAALGATHAGVPGSFRITIIAALIVLIPGLTLTVAMTELATRNLVSGTTRLTAAAIVFLEIAFGVALAEQVMTRWLGVAVGVPSASLPVWTEPIALLVAALSIAVLFHTHPRSLPGVVVACVAGFYGARLGAWLLGPQLGAGLGAFIIAAGANAYARLADRPAMVPLIPGILLLVPGSLGFRSLSAMMERDVVTGIDTAFAMILVAVSLVAGLLIANATISPRREL
ncbi:MAG TPA: threonine/serine exporter family protein [Kofleriaceae bacterium]|nr:threonine/serine exporter family protein [Kofleriaceae bacterium]